MIHQSFYWKFVLGRNMNVIRQPVACRLRYPVSDGWIAPVLTPGMANDRARIFKPPPLATTRSKIESFVSSSIESVRLNSAGGPQSRSGWDFPKYSMFTVPYSRTPLSVKIFTLR